MSPLATQFWKQQPARAESSAGKKIEKWLTKNEDILKSTYLIKKRFSPIDSALDCGKETFLF